MERPQDTTAIRDTDIMRRIEAEAKKETPFKNIKPVVIHTFNSAKIRSKVGDFNSNILKDASPTAILNILKDKNKIEDYYSSNIANRSPEFTPQKMRETLIRILLIRIIENIIYICSEDITNVIENVKPPPFEEFITELHSKEVFPLNASNIETLIIIIGQAIKLLSKDETTIARDGEAILALTIWKFTLNLDQSKKAEKITPILENIKTTLESEKISIPKRIKASNKIPGPASRPGTRRAQRAGNKSNRTRKKH